MMALMLKFNRKNKLKMEALEVKDWLILSVLLQKINMDLRKDIYWNVETISLMMTMSMKSLDISMKILEKSILGKWNS